jgi:hypothetical protein
MTRIPSHTVQDAPAASRALLEDMLQFSPTGRLLNMHAQMAHAPAVLDAYTSIRRATARHGTLDPAVRAALMLGLAVIGSVAWTVVNRGVKDSLGRLSAGHTSGVRPGSPVYDHALATGVTAALTIGAGATVLALVVTLVTIRVRRQDLPDSPLVM